MAGNSCASMFRRVFTSAGICRIHSLLSSSCSLARNKWCRNGVAFGLIFGAAAGIYLDELDGFKASEEMAWCVKVAEDLRTVKSEIRKSLFSNVFPKYLTHVFLGELNMFHVQKAISGYPNSIDDSSLQGKSDDGLWLNRYSVSNAAARAAPAVVNITATIGIHSMLLGKYSGSGFIIDPDGTILTNAHVVADAGKGPQTGKLIVTMQDGRTFNGEVVNYDLLADIAVIKVQSKVPLPTATLGSCRNLRPGEWVVALGSPLHLQNSVTLGIISRVVRPWLGMKMLELTEPIIGQLKERDPTFPDVSKGVLVPQVIPGSPAERGGIRIGDVIVQFDKKPISSINQIVEALGDKIGVGFEVVVKRAHNQQHTFTVVTEEATPSF